MSSTERGLAPGVEAVACPLCGLGDQAPLLEKAGYRVVRCKACKLAYVNPRPSAVELARLYSEQLISGAQHFIHSAPEDSRSYGSRVAHIERFQRPGRLLEVGCGPGTLMLIARGRGWEVQGLEISATAIAHAHSLGLAVLDGSLPHPALAGERFDAVVMNDVIEHLPDPGRAVDAVRELLLPGGVFFITTPDIGSPVARLLGRRWVHLKPREHLLYFDRRTIRRFLEERGFELLDLRSMGRVRNLDVALERLESSGLGPGGLGSLARHCLPRGLCAHINLPLNPGDEMAIIARATSA